MSGTSPSSWTGTSAPGCAEFGNSNPLNSQAALRRQLWGGPPWPDPWPAAAPPFGLLGVRVCPKFSNGSAALVGQAIRLSSPAFRAAGAASLGASSATTYLNTLKSSHYTATQWAGPCPECTSAPSLVRLFGVQWGRLSTMVVNLRPDCQSTTPARDA